MNSKARLIRHPLPALPEDLLSETRDVLTLLESNLANENHLKTLVKMEGGLNPDPFLLFVDRLLQFTNTNSILLLVNSSSKPALLRAWKHTLSLQDGQRLSERYLTSYSPQGPLARQTRVCISTLREMQFCLQRSEQISKAFRAVLVYDVPATLSPVWQRVMGAFPASYLIGFCWRLTPQVSEWFGNNVISVQGENAVHPHLESSRPLP